MKLEGPAGVIDWAAVPETRHAGLSGTASIRAFRWGDQQMRLVTYSPGYVADHWCSKGHLTFVISGAVNIEQADGNRLHAGIGTSYHVGDGEARAHRLSSPAGATLFIVD